MSWKSAETGTSSTDADWEGFQAATRAADRAHEEAKAKEAAAAKKGRPIKVKTFEV